MIQKQSNDRHSGRTHNHHEQKWRSRSAVQQRACSLFFFFNVKGIVHHEFVPPNTMVNSDFYCDILRHLRENEQQKRPELWRNHNQLLHHDNVPTHMSLKTKESVTNNNMIIFPHPSYSLHIAPCDFALFPKLKMKLKRRFETMSDIQRELQAILDSIKENDCHSAFEAWKKRWDHCTHSQRGLF
jgi:hypothetical protein